MALTTTQKTFISQIATAAIKYYPKYKILPSMTIAQALLESSWNRSGLAKDCHNYFGMKYKEGCGTDYKTYTTCEQKPDGTIYKIVAKFRKYDTLAHGIKGYYDFLNYSRYENLKGVTDYKESCTLIRKDGWATDLNYTKKLINIIETYKLYEYDKEVLKKKIVTPIETITGDSSEEDIKWLQTKLNECLKGVKGYMALKVDGDYGQTTRAALLLYWKQLGWNASSGWKAGLKSITALASGRCK